VDIHINRESEVPIQEQVAAQIVFLIGTGRCAPGTDLPSAQQLSKRLGVHRNTIKQAYNDLILKLLVEKRPGRRLKIRGGVPEIGPRKRDLDDLLNATILEAGRLGCSLQELHNRLRDRLYAAPADHVLALSAEDGMRALMLSELRQRFKCSIESCTPDELLLNPEKGIGAVVVTPPGHIPKIESSLAPGHLPVPIRYSSAATVIEKVRLLQKPSLIGIASISEYFLGMARGVLAPAVGKRHSMRAYLMKGSGPSMPGAADVVVCDAVTYPVVRARHKAGLVLEYRLISPASLEQISSLLARAV